LAPQIDRVLVLHDFDISGFSIFGTLAADGRRYVYENAVNMVDLGLRLADVRVLGLQSEPVAVSDRDNQGGEEQRVLTSGVLFSDDYGSG